MNELAETLHRVFLEPLHLQSDFAREHAQEVATLASMGFISNLEQPNTYGRRWRVTGLGIDILRKEGKL